MTNHITSINSVTGTLYGYNYVEFDDGQIVKFNLPRIKIEGLLWGDRIISQYGPMIFDDKKNNIRAEVEIQPKLIPNSE